MPLTLTAGLRRLAAPVMFTRTADLLQMVPATLRQWTPARVQRFTRPEAERYIPLWLDATIHPGPWRDRRISMEPSLSWTTTETLSPPQRTVRKQPLRTL